MGIRWLLRCLGTKSSANDGESRVLGRDSEKASSESSSSLITVTTRQKALLLYGPKQPYVEISDHPTPVLLSHREFLVRNRVIGLNPIDWKAPDFNFGIPVLPYISGRELVGEVAVNPRKKSRFSPGDQVIVISSDYRDLRKAAYQQYVVATDFNAARLPPNISPESGSATGVAFIAAAIALGICAGLDFSNLANGPDMLSMVRNLEPDQLPNDIRAECLSGINKTERAQKGDWIAIWGGSSTSAFIVSQIARLLGLRIVSVMDCRKHSVRISSDSRIRPDVLVDNHDPQRAIEIIRTATNNNLRFAIDTVGSETATYLMQSLKHSSVPSADQTKQANQDPSQPPAHLIGLTGLPKVAAPSNVKFHTVPIKVFHEVPEIGEAMMLWLERLLSQGLLVPPTIVGVEEGFGSINRALDSMRKGEISGGRLVVRVSQGLTVP